MVSARNFEIEDRLKSEKAFRCFTTISTGPRWWFLPR